MHVAKLRLGRIVATPGALRVIAESEQEPLHFLQLHASGAWGDLSREDREANKRAIAREDDPDQRDRVLSSYFTRAGMKLWVITERDRTMTTLLLPEEY
jgi:hypothetical protein